MTLDVRTPVAILFLVLGALLLLFGLVSDAAIYQRSLGVNVNVIWGVAMILFGAGMLVWRSISRAIVVEPAIDRSEDQTRR